MPLQAPNLDDRTFADLLREAQLRVRQYVPEWTDFNEGDPGTAIVQLFAWFTELMLYQMNRVPERNYVKLLQLLNLEREPARPARAHVVFTPSEGERKKVTVPERTRLTVDNPDGGDPLVFETVAGFDACPHPLDAVQVYDGADFHDVTALNDADGVPWNPLGWNPQPGNALYLGFKPVIDKKPDNRAEVAPAGFPERLVLRTFLPTRAADGPPPHVKSGEPPPPPAVQLAWEYRSKLDEGADRWRPLTRLTDETAELTREGRIELRIPADELLATYEGVLVPAEPPTDPPTEDQLKARRFWLRCRLGGGAYPRDRVPRVASVRANVVEVVNLATVRDEEVAVGDGFSRGDEDDPVRFRLRRRPVDPSSLDLVVEVPGRPVEGWKRVEDFDRSGPNDPHYTLNPSTGELRFGNGRTGRIPEPGARVVARSYRYGGGAAGGKLRAGAISAPPATVPGVDAVTNPRPAFDGKDEEPVEQLMERAPRAIRGDRRAVTADDYRTHAEKLHGVAKAAVLERRHPHYPGADIPGAVTVAVVPDGMPAGSYPSPALIEHVARELGRLRVVRDQEHGAAEGREAVMHAVDRAVGRLRSRRGP